MFFFIFNLPQPYLFSLFSQRLSVSRPTGRLSRVPFSPTSGRLRPGRRSCPLQRPPPARPAPNEPAAVASPAPDEPAPARPGPSATDPAVDVPDPSHRPAPAATVRYRVYIFLFFYSMC
jgi:hypothetical protein